jgi:hypothetical protein
MSARELIRLQVMVDLAKPPQESREPEREVSTKSAGTARWPATQRSVNSGDHGSTPRVRYRPFPDQSDYQDYIGSGETSMGDAVVVVHGDGPFLKETTVLLLAGSLQLTGSGPQNRAMARKPDNPELNRFAWQGTWLTEPARRQRRVSRGPMLRSLGKW